VSQLIDVALMSPSHPMPEVLPAYDGVRRIPSAQSRGAALRNA